MRLRFKACFLAWLVFWLTCDVGQSTNWTLWNSSVWRRTSPACLFTDFHAEVTTQVSRWAQLPSAVAQECVRWKSLFCILLDTASPISFFLLHIVLFLTSAASQPLQVHATLFWNKLETNQEMFLCTGIINEFYWKISLVLLFFRDRWKGEDWQWDLHCIRSVYFDCYLKLLWDRVT